MSVILYVDTSEVRDGALEELKQAINGLVDFVEAKELQLIAYNVYFSDDGTHMTVVACSRRRVARRPADDERVWPSL